MILQSGQYLQNITGNFIFSISSMPDTSQPSWMLSPSVDACSEFLMSKVLLREYGLQIPAGSLPRTMEVILRADNVEKARAGDKVTFIGNPIVVPDVAAISAPGERVQMQPGVTLPHAWPCPRCMACANVAYLLIIEMIQWTLIPRKAKAPSQSQGTSKDLSLEDVIVDGASKVA